MITDAENIKKLLLEINELVKSGSDRDLDETFWLMTGIKLLTFIRDLLDSPEKVRDWTEEWTEEYSADKLCLIGSIFVVLYNIPNPSQRLNDELMDGQPKYGDKFVISFYELAFARCISMISLIRANRFRYLQKMLIRHIFGKSYVCSLFASDLYMFIFRIIHPHRQMEMCQLIMNFCRRAPSEAFVKGAALINRINHPTINFENPKYQYLMEIPNSQ